MATKYLKYLNEIHFFIIGQLYLVQCTVCALTVTHVLAYELLEELVNQQSYQLLIANMICVI